MVRNASLTYLYFKITEMAVRLQIKLPCSMEQQGNRFRTLIIARVLRLTGFVAEEPGHLWIEAEGEEPQLDQLIGKLKEMLYGIDFSRMEITEKPLVFGDDFRIM
jgi:acylphosphatase